MVEVFCLFWAGGRWGGFEKTGSCFRFCRAMCDCSTSKLTGKSIQDAENESNGWPGDTITTREGSGWRASIVGVRMLHGLSIRGWSRGCRLEPTVIVMSSVVVKVSASADVVERMRSSVMVVHVACTVLEGREIAVVREMCARKGWLVRGPVFCVIIPRPSTPITYSRITPK